MGKEEGEGSRLNIHCSCQKDITLTLFAPMGELCQGLQGLVTDLIGQLLSMQEAENPLESRITNGTPPQQGNLECVRP